VRRALRKRREKRIDKFTKIAALIFVRFTPFREKKMKKYGTVSPPPAFVEYGHIKLRQSPALCARAACERCL
jgi:hypothetical protein